MGSVETYSKQLNREIAAIETAIEVMYDLGLPLGHLWEAKSRLLESALDHARKTKRSNND